MERRTVPTPQEFDVTPTSVIHKPTGATWTTYRDSRFANSYTPSLLGRVLPNGDDYREDEVVEMAKTLLARRLP